MGKRLVLYIICLVLIALFLYIGYMFGVINSKQTDEFDLSREIYSKAQFEYKSADYTNTLKYLEVANDIYKDYDTSIALVKKIRNLNSQLDKSSLDYKLYIERGDIQNIKPVGEPGKTSSITSNYCAAIEDYSKALKLNANANEVYHKRAKAYIGCKKSIDFKKDIVKDYEKAISLASDKDYLLEEIADWFLYDVDDAVSALRYYDKIQDFTVNKTELLNNKMSFSIENIKYVPFKKITCYEKIKNYDAILKLLDEITDETDNSLLYQKANNLKFYYDIKTYNFNAAINEAANCNAMICKVINFMNFKNKTEA